MKQNNAINKEIKLVYKKLNYAKKEYKSDKKLIKNIEYLLSIFRSQYKRTMSVVDEYNRKNSKTLNGIETLPLIYSNKNFYYLLAANKLLASGLINPSTSLLRSVFETIIENYFILLNYKVKDVFPKKNYGLSELRFNDLLFRKKVNSKLLPKEKVILRKLNIKKIRDVIYKDKKSLEIFDYLYNKLSISVHPNIERAFHEELGLKYDAVQRQEKETLIFLIILLMDSIFVLNKSYKIGEWTPENEIKEYKGQIKNIFDTIEKSICPLNKEIIEKMSPFDLEDNC